jgi:hypothetical protein
VALAASAPTTAAPPLPPRSIKIQSSVKVASSWGNWLEEWPLLAGAAAALGLLIYLVTRLWLRRAKHQENRQAPTPELSPQNQDTNTVFGLNEQEANAMHKEWLSQKILQKM